MLAGDVVGSQRKWKNAVLVMMLSHYVKHVCDDVVHGMTHSRIAVGLTRRQAAAGIHCSNLSSKSSELRRLSRLFTVFSLHTMSLTGRSLYCPQ
jgi:hypothetical protein